MTAIVAGVGLLANAIWTALNMKMRSDLREWIEGEFVSEQVCRLRMYGEKATEHGG
jgi:hypothetical protein